jgi:hypothetical protein
VSQCNVRQQTVTEPDGAGPRLGVKPDGAGPRPGLAPVRTTRSRSRSRLGVTRPRINEDTQVKVALQETQPEQSRTILRSKSKTLRVRLAARAEGLQKKMPPLASGRFPSRGDHQRPSLRLPFQPQHVLNFKLKFLEGRRAGARRPGFK